METWRDHIIGLTSPPDSTSCRIRNVTLPPQAECVCLSSSCVVHGNLHRAHERMTEAWVTVTLTLAGLQDNPVGGGVALHLPAGTQAGRLDLVCLKVGHAQKHCSETETRLGHAADSATVTPQSEVNSGRIWIQGSTASSRKPTKLHKG